MPVIGDLLSGFAFTTCALASAAPTSGSPSPSPGRRREVVVSGKRVKTVDIHAHCAVPAAMALVNLRPDASGLLMTDTANRIAAMDAQGIDVEALSINPYWYGAERDVAAELIRIQNEALVEFCAANPERFVAFATAALQFPDLAADQVDYGVKTLGFRALGLPAVWLERNWRIQSSTPSGLNAKSLASSCSCIHSERANWSRAVAFQAVAS